jgi:alpha-amylase/alpha-mannosidase (GH57 family)
MHLPQHSFYPGGAERAAWHIQEGLRVFTSAFGVRPVGCWPSEGAVSRATLELLETSGFRWTATGANVLRNSLTPQSAEEVLAYNKPYALPQSKLSCFFRDDTLSDLIGFTYATWHGDDAAHNLTNELAQLAQRYADSPNHAVLIALDGENAWEHYPFNGYYFLRALYAGLTTHPQLELMTLSECLARGIQPTPLQRVTAGSWVHGTLATWMGDPAKNRAWDLLCDAKVEVDRVLRSAKLDRDQTVALERQLALCESSDWFWWFGDYNPQDAVSQFDRLFRRQLMNLYSLLGITAPETLSEPISVGRGTPEHGGTMRRAI